VVIRLLSVVRPAPGVSARALWAMENGDAVLDALDAGPEPLARSD
jgi:hypothetical protein